MQRTFAAWSLLAKRSPMPKSGTETQFGTSYETVYGVVGVPTLMYHPTYGWYNSYSYVLDGSSVMSSYVTGTHVRDRTFFGSRTPDYQYKKKNGIIIPTLACTDTLVDRHGIPTTSYFTQGSLTTRKSVVNIVGPVEPFPWDGEDSVEMAWSKLRQKVLSQDLNAGVVLAEANKTSAMIYETARKLALAYRALRKGNVVKVNQYLGLTNRRHRAGFQKDLRRDLAIDRERVHGYWLELQYGWKPLISDVYGAAATVAKAHSEQRNVLKTSASHKSNPIAKTLNQCKGTVSQTGKAWITYRVSNDGLVAMNQLGLLNPLLIAWELVPFSFVADWFVNIGDVLQESTAFAGLTILDSGSSRKTVTSGTYAVWEYPAYQTSYTYTIYQRSPGHPSFPKLRFKTNPFSMDHILNGAALIREVWRR